MQQNPVLQITSPSEQTNTNKTVIDIQIALISDNQGGGKGDSFKYFKLLQNGEIVAEYHHTGKKALTTYKFTKIDFAPFANSGFPVKIEAVAYTGKSLTSTNIVSNPVYIIVDTTCPRLEELHPENGAFLNNVNTPITAHIYDDGGSHIDRNSIQLIVDDQAIEPTTVKKSIISNDSIQIRYESTSPLAEKEHYYKIEVKDQAGNVVRSPRTKFLIDAIPPHFQSLEPANNSKLNRRNPIITATVLKKDGAPLDLDSIRVILDGTVYSEETAPSWITTSWPTSGQLEIKFSPAELSEGLHSVIFKLKDRAGNLATSSELLFTVDVSPPLIFDILPEAETIHSSATPEISAIINDGGGSKLEQSSIKVILDGKSFAPKITTIEEFDNSETVKIEYRPAKLTDGSHTLAITASDEAGNESTSSELSFIVDTTPPVTGKVFPSGAVAKDKLSEPVTITASDINSGIDLSACAATVTASSGAIYNLKPQSQENSAPGEELVMKFEPLPHIGLLGIGTHQLELELSDIAGNQQSKSYSFEIKHAIPFENDNFQALRNFTDLKNKSTLEPYLLPPDFSYGEEVKIEIPGVASGSAGWKSSVENSEATAKKGSTTLTLKIPGDLVWSAEANARSQLKENIATLLLQLETKEGGQLNHGTLEIIQSRIARALPLAFSELLPWNCGVNPSVRAVVLRPGFRLRVSNSSFQYCGPGRDELNGMVPTGDNVLPVNRQRIEDGSFITTLNPMATGLADSSYTAAVETTDSMIGGLADLHAAELQRKYLAVVLPATLPASTTESAVGEEHAALVAADSLAALNAGIGSAAGDYNESNGEYVLRHFRGRSTVVVEIPLLINGEKSYFSIGSTLRQACEGYLHWFSPLLLEKGQVTWRRQWSGTSDTINLRNTGWSDLGLTPPNQHIDLADAPLLPGDQIEFKLD